MSMAMQSGIGISKILIIAGAGYTGTVLIKNGKLSDLLAELQLLVKGLEKSSDQGDGEGEYADAIAAQVRRLANEVRQLASNRPITVLNGGGSGQSNLSSLVVPAAALGALGYGYMWWKGISFSDLMYVTKRNMEKAVSDLTKKLQHASDVIADAKKHLTQRIQNLDDKMVKQNELARSIKNDVAGVRSTITNFHDDLGFLQQTVESLDERVSALSWKQDYANHGLAYLIDFVHGRRGKMPEFLQQDQPKLSGKSPSLLTYPGTPNLKGLKDIAETLSSGLDRSASDAVMPDDMAKLGQLRRPLLRSTTTRC
ncbi:uncharacterized protein LOC133285550 isoform X1 [Gastrolobium bilobum]|uniref:uncharacterized protein LOC133285550 isoform X1 n=1 Tax=Gastrolobium bilobum TaxID=150636 RepID=UPI002AAF13D3|nr:uncharacterized protein LOC133285550 isoform X1 [Gastrolobium bilobum]